MKRIYLSLLCLLLPAFFINADDEQPVAKSFAIILDLSYSMRLLDPNETGTRLSRMQNTLKYILTNRNNTDNKEEWALITFDTGNTADILVPFTTRSESLVSAFAGLDAWGTTSLAEAIDMSVSYLHDSGKGAEKYLLLASDCINTERSMFVLPEASGLTRSGIRVVVVGFNISENPSLQRHIVSWVESIGGVFFLSSQTSQLESYLFSDNGWTADIIEEPKETVEDVAAVDVAVGNPEEENASAYYEMAKPEKRLVEFPIWWVFALLFAVGAGFFIQRAVKWFRKARKIANFKSERIPEIILLIDKSDGSSEARRFTDFPINISSDKRSDLYLPKPMTQGKAKRFALNLVGGKIQMQAPDMLLVNGVGTRSKTLKEHDRIVFGRYRLQYSAMVYKREPAPITPKPLFLAMSPILVAIVVAGLLYNDPITIKVPAGKNAAQNGFGIFSEALFPHESEVTAPRDTLPPKEEREEAPVVEAASSPFHADKSEAEIQLGNPNEPLIVNPGSTPDFFKADMLFIHTHPDDESIDFGTLMARASRARKKIVMVVLTDGESGLDRYPWRIVNEQYPAYDLRGDALARVRVEEAWHAISILGAKMYVRLGYTNSPYGGIRDEMRYRSVMAKWGGEDHVVNQIKALVVGFQPDIVVSPEGPSTAREHFEHEATGQAVAKALAELEQEDRVRLRGRLVSIDALQKHRYDDELAGINAMLIDSVSQLAFRTIQAEALKQHITQRDASEIGVENLSNYDKEYYKVLRWELRESIEEYLSS